MPPLVSNPQNLVLLARLGRRRAIATATATAVVSSSGSSLLAQWRRRNLFVHGGSGIVGSVQHRLAINPTQTKRLSTKANAALDPSSSSPSSSSFSNSRLKTSPLTSTATGDHSSADSSSSIPFSTLQGKIHPDTLEAITNGPYRYETMSAVQSKVLVGLPDIIGYNNNNETEEGVATTTNGKDFLVKAKTGTGKTLAFLVPAIERRIRDLESRFGNESGSGNGSLEEKRRRARVEREYASLNPGVLVISPTRELATQIAVEAQNLSVRHANGGGVATATSASARLRGAGEGGGGFGVVCLLGGESRWRQVRDWVGDKRMREEKGERSSGVMGVRKDVVVATPGRMLDLLKGEAEVREAMSRCGMVVLDEADTLLDMGFRGDIEQILSYLPGVEKRLTWMFSATINRGVETIAREALRGGYEFVDCVGMETPVHEHIPQFHTVLPSGREAVKHLVRVLAHDQLVAKQEGKKSKVVVFLSTTKMVAMVTEVMKMVLEAGVLPCRTWMYEMHSGRSMEQRVRTSKAFREGDRREEASVMITSDVSARGVDYPGVTRVVQLGLPANKEMYVHRVGRTGRGASKEGRGDLVISPWEMPFLRRFMGDVGMEPVTVEGMKNEMEELGRTVAGGACSGRLMKIDGVVDAVCTSLDPREYSRVYASQLGFYMGHVDELGLTMRDVLEGLGTFMQQIGGLPGVPALTGQLAMRINAMVGKTTTARARATTRTGIEIGMGTMKPRGGDQSWASFDGGKSLASRIGGPRSWEDKKKPQNARWGEFDDRRTRSAGRRMWESAGSGIRGGYEDDAKLLKVKGKRPHWSGRGSNKVKKFKEKW